MLYVSILCAPNLVIVQMHSRMSARSSKDLIADVNLRTDPAMEKLDN